MYRVPLFCIYIVTTLSYVKIAEIIQGSKCGDIITSSRCDFRNTLLPLSRRENELHLQSVQFIETYFHLVFRPLSRNNKIFIPYTLSICRYGLN